MTRIGRTETKPGFLPTIHGAGQGLAAGHVYVQPPVPGGITESLDAGQKAVLKTLDGKTLEVLTTNHIGGGPVKVGTYLNAADFAKVTDRTAPTIRLYTWRDSLKKIETWQGAILLATSIFAALTAAVAIAYVFLVNPAPTASQTADTAQTVLAWVRQPIDQLPSGADQATQAAAAATVRARADTAVDCLQQVAGNQAPSASIPGVTCSSASPPWWRTASAASLLAGVLAFLTGVLGIFGLQGKYGFQKTPAG